MIIGVWALEFIWLLYLGYWLFPYRVFGYFINADDAGFWGFGKDADILGAGDCFVGRIFAYIWKDSFLGKLPGDIYVSRKNFTFYFPLATCILFSLIFSLIARLWSKKVVMGQLSEEGKNGSCPRLRRGRPFLPPFSNQLQKIAVFWLFLGLGFIYPARGIYADEVVRIAVLQEEPSFYLQIKGAFEIQDESGRQVYKGKNLKKRLIKADSGKIILPGSLLNLVRLKIFPKSGYAYINNRLYRGRVSIIPKENARFLVVNELDPENYLRGILCNEIAPWWPLDALKAQAVVARTYALYQRQFTKNKDFDLTNDIYSQVYGGKTSEKWRSNRAVDLTRGEILTFKEIYSRPIIMPPAAGTPKTRACSGKLISRRLKA